MWKFLFEINKPCGGEYYSKLELPRDWLEFHIAFSKILFGIWEWGIKNVVLDYIRLDCIGHVTWKKNLFFALPANQSNIEKSMFSSLWNMEELRQKF